MMPTTVFDRSGGTDPVCKRTVREADGLTALYRGRTYRFCCPGCKREFELNPQLYTRRPAESHR
jgi:YHS domain-containing protein